MVILAFSHEIDEKLAKTILVLAKCGFTTLVCMGKKDPSSKEVLITRREKDVGERFLVQGKIISYVEDDPFDDSWWPDLYQALIEVLNKEFSNVERIKAIHPMEKLLNY